MSILRRSFTIGGLLKRPISPGSIPAASTIFEERNSLLLKGIVFSCSSPTAAFCMNIALSAAGAGGADTLVHPLDRPGHPRCRLPGRKRRASAVRSTGGLTPGCPLGARQVPLSGNNMWATRPARHLIQTGACVMSARRWTPPAPDRLRADAASPCVADLCSPTARRPRLVPTSAVCAQWDRETSRS